ncbi:hypothetical protein BD324DRAFT_651542 [Kockovaella imperatae]|uniref:ESCO1/2 acetyl-transferase-domain-containing protein n=1 Tax=Kockovaella imperatae TaxID=4999 RepID=A0A1Y1UE28_9TREE|nr:hypothetical protein BD324DRAFT_651542 [Kockovaella imperatae]ORX36301.1 hypothetical protein BD324DRAFT_651542 [Kockovaella imperatae]
MSEKPIIRRTYGKISKPSSSSSAILFFPDPVGSSSNDNSQNRSLLLQDAGPRSSSPLLSSILGTPNGSTDRAEDVFAAGSSSPMQRRSSPSPLLDDIDLKKASGIASSILRQVSTQSSLKSFFGIPSSTKRPLKPTHTVSSPTTTAPASNARAESSKSARHLTQMHLTHLPLFHTCKECSMSYLRGGGEDESVHAKHHLRVVHGIPWDGLGKSSKASKSASRGVSGSSSERSQVKSGGWTVVQSDVEFGQGKQRGVGRVVMCDGSWGGTKASLLEICHMVDTVLSAPALPTPILDTCKIFLFLTTSPAPSGKRLRPGSSAKGSNKERIVSVVVAQPIKTAMRVLKEMESVDHQVDSGGGVVCDPTLLPTPLGIHRLFTVPAYRNLSLSRTLLNAACEHTIYGMTIDPSKGHVAFSQPTDSGKKVMLKWGGGSIRVFVDDERQL